MRASISVTREAREREREGEGEGEEARTSRGKRGAPFNAKRLSAKSSDAALVLPVLRVFGTVPDRSVDATPSAISLFLSRRILTGRESPHHLPFVATVFLGGKGPRPPRLPYVRFSLCPCRSSSPPQPRPPPNFLSALSSLWRWKRRYALRICKMDEYWAKFVWYFTRRDAVHVICSESAHPVSLSN